MIRVLKYFLVSLGAAWIALFAFSETSTAQHLLHSWLESAGRTCGVTIRCGRISLGFPFSMKTQIFRVYSEDETELLSCESLSVTPLLIDLPLGRLTLLRLKGRGIEINGDALERCTSGKNIPLPTLSIHAMRLSSVHVTSSHIPNEEKAVDGSLKGHLFLTSDLSHVRCSLSCWRSTPSAWPKEVDFTMKKSNQEWSLTSSLSLEGASSSIPQLFFADDRLETSLHWKSNSLSGTWKLICPRAQIYNAGPVLIPESSYHPDASKPRNDRNFRELALERFLKANGTICYQPSGELTISCDSLHAVVVAGEFVEAIRDPENNSLYQEPLLAPVATLRINGSGAISALRQTDGAVFHLEVPSLSVNDKTGPLSGLGKLVVTPEGLSASCDLIGSLLRSSIRYQVEPLSQKLSAFIRFQDLSLLDPSVHGAAELSSHAHISDDHSSLSISGHIEELRSALLDCRNLDIALSGDPLNLTSLSANIDVADLRSGRLQLEQAHLSSSYTLRDQKIPSLETHLRGQYGQLPFDLFAYGSGQSNLSQGELLFRRLEGRIANHPFTIDRPLDLSHEDFRLSSFQMTASCGEKGHFHIDLESPSPTKALVDLSCEQMPLEIVANLCRIADAKGCIDATCHYQAQPHFCVGTLSYNASVQQFGVFGGEGRAIACGGTASLQDSILSTTFCAAGAGIHEPLVGSLSCHTARIKGSPFFTILPTTPLQGSLKGEISLSKLLSRWQSGQAGLDGRITCDFVFGGSFQKPSLTGPVHVRSGRIDLLPTGEVIDEIAMDGKFDNGSIHVDTITATDGKEGKVTGSGTFDITPQYDILWKATLVCTNVEIVTHDYANVIADGTVELAGTLSTLHVSGKVQTKHVLIDLSARFPSDIPEIPVTYRGAPPESPPFLVTFALQFDASQGAVIRGRGVSSLWMGQMRMTGSANAIEIQGQLNCQKGTFMLGSKELSITEGSMTCAGNLFRDSRCVVRADISLPAITAQVYLRGSLEKPKFSIQSSPPRPVNEILSLLLFNKEYGDISSLESLQLANTAMSLDQSSGPFELIERIKETLGIDIIDIGSANPLPLSNQPPTALDPTDASTAQQLQQNDVSLKVGKYVMDGVVVSVSKDVSTSANRIGVEAQLSKEVAACAAVGDDAEGILSIKWKHHY